MGRSVEQQIHRDRAVRHKDSTHHRDMFESQETLPTEIVRRLHLPDEDDILDTDTEAPVCVISGFCNDTIK